VCQLFGFTADKKISFTELFEEFRTRARTNPHAWGASLWFDDRGPLVVRDPRRADLSEAADMIKQIPATALIAHIRYGTVKPLDSVTNAHPFVANVDGKDWAFAHNGFLKDVEEASKFAEHYAPIGTTDSEQFFSILIDYLHNKKNRATAVALAAKRFAKSGKLNFIFSNGEEFYFFTNHNGGLHYKATKNAVYVATQPVGCRVNWFPAKPGTLYVAVRGKITAKVVVEEGETYTPKKKKAQFYFTAQEWKLFRLWMEEMKGRGKPVHTYAQQSLLGIGGKGAS
jgi:glutamine amidotransferase